MLAEASKKGVRYRVSTPPWRLDCWPSLRTGQVLEFLRREVCLGMGFQLICCWPGLAALWRRGNVRSLVAALLFSWAISVLLLATFVWPAWFGLFGVRLFWFVAGVAWLVSCVHSHWFFSQMIEKTDPQSQSAFEKAQQCYLQGNWFEAEAILLELLDRFPRDAEALLLLVGVLRHTQRWQPALRRLDQLESLDSAAQWQFELCRERQIVEKKFAAALQEPK